MIQDEFQLENVSSRFWLFFFGNNLKPIELEENEIHFTVIQWSLLIQ